MRIFLNLLITIVLYGCVPAPHEDCGSRSLWGFADFPLGTAFDLRNEERNRELRTVFNTHFNSFTPENEFKFENIHPQPHQYNWFEADRIISFAQNKRVHGHTLIWHEQLPDWIFSAENHEHIMKEHIKAVVRRYSDKIKSWDVVNEALEENGNLRNSIWKQKIGKDYIYKAFKAASEADPDAELFYNDFNLALNPRKLDAVIDICTSLRKRGIDVSGIGMQMHISVSAPYPMEIKEAIDKIWRAGFKVHFSELDVSVNPLGNKTVISEDDLTDQYHTYYEVVKTYRSIPKAYQFGITLWGVGDADSWLESYFNRVDAGVLFDHSYRPKPAFCGFKKALSP